MIDCFFRWSDIAAAKADALWAAQKYYMVNGDAFSRDRILPNVQAWRPSLDTVVDGKVVHSYLTGWMAVVALNSVPQVVLDATALAFALNRDFDPLASPKNLVVRNNIGGIITDIAVSPIFAGSRYPIGGF
jgi:hypothetical protein